MLLKTELEPIEIAYIIRLLREKLKKIKEKESDPRLENHVEKIIDKINDSLLSL